jgi:hypothetical protein
MCDVEFLLLLTAYCLPLTLGFNDLNGR